MAKNRRGARRPGAERYHSASSLPRSSYNRYGGSVYAWSPYESRHSIAERGYGGGYLPHARRRAATSRTRLQQAPLPLRPTSTVWQWTPPPRSLVATRTNHSLKARLFTAFSSPTLLATRLGDSKSLPAKRPNRADFCIRRAARREVLFAKQVAGRPGSAPGQRGVYKRTVESAMSCKGRSA